MKKASNYQDLIKLLAVVAMIIDHIGLYFFPEVPAMRMIGRFAMPIFCFFAGYNYQGKIRLEVLLYGVLAYCVTALVHSKFITFNILISIFLGYIYLYVFYTQLKNFNVGYIHVIILSCTWSFTENLFDYGSVGTAIMVLGVIAKNDSKNFKLCILITQILSVFHTITVFDPSSSGLGLVLIMSILSYFLITSQNLKAETSFNLRLVTRNLLQVFFFQSVAIEIIWFLSLLVQQGKLTGIIDNM